MFQETGEKIPLELFCCLSRDMWHSWAHMEHPRPLSEGTPSITPSRGAAGNTQRSERNQLHNKSGNMGRFIANT